MVIERYFSSLAKKRKLKRQRIDCKVMGAEGRAVFEMKSVLAPAAWSPHAVEIAASKYFAKTKSLKEKSIFAMVDRVVKDICQAGLKQKYFSKKDATVFADELREILLSQRAAFNSPVWFNCGVEKQPQASACFILSIEDSLESIFDFAKTEAMLFKYGSGSGANFSSLRSSSEKLERGGTSSGLMSFLEVLDRGAGAIKSGGTTRRAAKMVCLDVDHPEILDFIRWKDHEESKAHALIRAGYSGGFEGEAYRTVSGQNSNNSVRLTHKFMKAVEQDRAWPLRERTTKKITKELNAREIFRAIADCAWRCADPGVQFHDTINEWHTCQASGDIVASNPCSEYMFLNNTSCNLASINLARFYDQQKFHWDDFAQTIRTVFLAQEILIDHSSYPTQRVADNSKKFRPLGMGYANLGGLLMQMGLAYDSDEARSWAGAITSKLTAECYRASVDFAKIKTPFAEFKKNKQSVVKVLKKHAAAHKQLEKEVQKQNENELNELSQSNQSELVREIKNISALWRENVKLAERYGIRNAQATAIAPTGTIGLMMDCDTLGIEPDYSLVKYKTLAGGGTMKIVNQSVSIALKNMNYSNQDIREILNFVESHNSVVGSKIKNEHQNIFACAVGENLISPMGHLRMMAAVQPFVSGAISKTVNLPEHTTVDEIESLYRDAYKMKLKSVAVYRDQSKKFQPLAQQKRDDDVLMKSESRADNPWRECPNCGGALELTSGCYRCDNCGTTLGCG